MCDVYTDHDAADVSEGGVARRTTLARVKVGNGARSQTHRAGGACDVERRIVVAPSAVGGGDGGHMTVETYYGSCAC